MATAEKLDDEWIQKLWYIYIHEISLSHKKRNGFESVEVRWVKLEPAIQSEVSQKERNKYINAYIYINGEPVCRQE